MPMYDYKCSNCKTELNSCLFKIDHKSPYCPLCNEVMKKNYQSMIPAYHDVPVNSIEFDMPGKPFVYHTRGQLKAEAKRRGLEVDLGLRSRQRFDG